MSKVFIEESTLTNIGSAIREMTGKTDLIAPGDMPTEIRSIETGGGDIPSEITLEQSSLDYFGYGDSYRWLCDMGIPVKFITEAYGATYFFQNASYTEDMSNLTFVFNGSMPTVFTERGFQNCYELKALPNIYVTQKGQGGSLRHYFSNCWDLRNIPDDFFKCHDEDGNVMDVWGAAEVPSVVYYYNSTFCNCYSLRNIPTLRPTWIGYNQQNMYSGCYSLDEIKNIPVSQASSSLNAYGAFDNCWRAKEVMFAVQEDSTPYSTTWDGSEISLTTYVGYASGDNLLSYNSGILAEKEVIDDITYKLLKDDPDWWTRDVNYSRYNHDSAVNTINSLPYVTAATIKFTGASGSATDGGAISNLTEDEIAVATAKGWTVEIV